MNQENNNHNNQSPIQFRMDALEHMWGHNERYSLNSLIPTYSWGYLIFACTTFLSLILWGMMGTVSDYVSGEGLLLTNAESISNVSAPAGINQIKEILVKEGDLLKVGDTIATFNNPELESQIPILKDKVQFFSTKLQEFKASSETEISARKSLIENQNKILEKIISVETNNLNEISKLLETQDMLSTKGLIRNFDKRVIQQQFADAQRSLENSNSQIIANEISLNAFKNEWQDRIRNLEMQEKEARIILSLQEEKLGSASLVKAQVAGKLIHIDKKAGDYVKDGESFAAIAASSPKDELKAVTYISGQKGKQVKPGMRVLVSPTTINKEEYGSIEGIIEEVSEYSVTPQEILSTLKNETIVKNLTSKDAPFKAIVRLETINGKLKWSASQGPEFPITEGTYVTTTVLVNRQSPISLIIPGLKKLSGVS